MRGSSRRMTIEILARARFLSRFPIRISNSQSSAAVLFKKAPGAPAFPLPRCQGEGDGAPIGASSPACAAPFRKPPRLSARHCGVLSRNRSCGRGAGPRLRAQAKQGPASSQRAPRARVIVPVGIAVCIAQTAYTCLRVPRRRPGARLANRARGRRTRSTRNGATGSRPFGRIGCRRNYS
jgi:hypothetical protein